LLRACNVTAGGLAKKLEASRPCWRCTWSSRSPLHQHRSLDGAVCQAVICRQPSFPGCYPSCVEQICLAKLHLLSHCIHSGEISKHSCFSDLYRTSSWHSSGPSSSSVLPRPLQKSQIRLD